MKVDCPPGETLSGKSARAVPCVVFVIMKGRQLVNGSEGVLNAEWVCTSIAGTCKSHPVRFMHMMM